jgi:Arc/MetJ-type ribon-helix-helix transcriptional regulator
MSTIRINLPDALMAFVDEQVAKAGYRNASEFRQSLLEAEVQRGIGREIEQLLLETVNGPFADWTEQDVEDIRRGGVKAIGTRQDKA